MFSIFFARVQLGYRMRAFSSVTNNMITLMNKKFDVNYFVIKPYKLIKNVTLTTHFDNNGETVFLVKRASQF
jgi:hypothetical protein